MFSYEILAEKMNKYPNMDVWSFDAMIMMHDACKHVYLDIFDFLVNKGFDVVNNGHLYLSLACVSGSLKIFSTVYQKMKEKKVFINTDEYILNATTLGHFDVVKFLLDTDDVSQNGIAISINVAHDTEIKNILIFYEYINFMRACRNGDHVRMYSTILDGRIDVNKKDHLGNTGLLLASFYGQFKVVELLLASSFDVDTTVRSHYFENKTAYELAVTSNKKIAKLIRKYEADRLETIFSLRVKLGLMKNIDANH